MADGAHVMQFKSTNSHLCPSFLSCLHKWQNGKLDEVHHHLAGEKVRIQPDLLHAMLKILSCSVSYSLVFGTWSENRLSLKTAKLDLSLVGGLSCKGTNKMQKCCQGRQLIDFETS